MFPSWVVVQVEVDKKNPIGQLQELNKKILELRWSIASIESQGRGKFVLKRRPEPFSESVYAETFTQKQEQELQKLGEALNALLMKKSFLLAQIDSCQSE
jgi:hypothetical protein